MTILADAALAFGVSVVLAPMVLRWLTLRQVLDVPTWRSSHGAPTPRGGGIAPAIGCVAAAVFSFDLSGATRIGLLLVAISMGLIGLVEDLRGLGAFYRLAFQLAASLGGAFWLNRALGGIPPLFVLLVLLWLLAYVNAFNFMDGINGISVIQVLVAGTTWMWLGYSENIPAFAVAGLVGAAAALAFGPFNSPRARMFLGDVGSYFFGGWLASTAVLGIGAGLPPEIVIAPLALYGVDTMTTLTKRVWRHEPWYEPHRDHAYQRLVRAGWTHTKTSLIVGLFMCITTAFAALTLINAPGARLAGDALAVAALATYLALPAVVSTRSLRI